MKTTARLISCPKESVIPDLIREYRSKTPQLILAYNADSFTPSRDYGVSVIPYHGTGKRVGEKYGFLPGTEGHPRGTNWKVWAVAAEQFPDISFWVIHDYDVVCRPDDQALCSKIPANSYGMIGQPIPRYRDGIRVRTHQETSPFFHERHQQLWHAKDAPTQHTDHSFLDVLEKEYPYIENGVRTVLCGYGDIIVAPTALLRELNNPILQGIEVGGIEQVIHTVSAARGYRAYDLSKDFRTRILFSPPIWFSMKDEIIHPVKEWVLMESAFARYKHFFWNAVVRWVPKILPQKVIRGLSSIRRRGV